MAMKLYSETDIENIAEAIREPNGSSTTYKVREMATGINNLVDTLISYIPHTNTSGNPLNINSIPLKPKELDIVGDSKQQTLTGKNIFKNDISIWGHSQRPSYDNDTDIYTFHHDGGVDYLINYGSQLGLEPNTTYKLYFNVLENSMTARFSLVISSFATGSFAIEAGQTGVFAATLQTGSSATSYDLWFYCNSRGTMKAKIMLIKGNVEIGEYEPYCGGVPSPNPAYPQPINVVKSTNGIINYKMVENLFDSEAWFNSISTSSSYYINRKIKENNKYKFIGNNSTSRIDTGNRYSTTIKPNTDYVFTFDYNSTATPNAFISLFISNDYTIDTMKYGAYRIGEINPSSGKAVLNFNSENNTLFYFHGYTNYAEISNTLEIWNIMLIEKDFIKTIPFNIGNTEFCKLPNGVADKLWVNLRTGQYGKTGNVGKIVLDGTEEWSNFTILSITAQIRLLMNFKSRYGYSNNFIVKSTYDDDDHIVIGGGLDALYIHINKAKLSTQDVSGFKNWLSTHNTELYYELVTPTTEVLGTLSKENLAKLVMYNGTNNISIDGYDNNGAEPVIEIDYYTQV